MLTKLFDISSLFSSAARLKVLRTLFYQSAPLPLRHIAYLSDAPLYSVQRVLYQLRAEKILFRKRKGRHTLFSLNRHHAYYPFLADLFEIEMKSRLAFLSNNYHQKAKRVLDFSSSARRFFVENRLWEGHRSKDTPPCC